MVQILWSLGDTALELPSTYTCVHKKAMLLDFYGILLLLFRTQFPDCKV